METGCFLTKRGRRAASLIGAAMCWVLMVAMLTVAWAAGSENAGRIGLATSAVAAAWTICIVIGRHSDLVVAAYVAGREEGRAEVLKLRP